jgi:hypothetical protein
MSPKTSFIGFLQGSSSFVGSTFAVKCFSRNFKVKKVALLSRPLFNKNKSSFLRYVWPPFEKKLEQNVIRTNDENAVKTNIQSDQCS